jgi:acyl-CoA synthetase (AMP-forming)/AMP-acid ligase II
VSLDTPRVAWEPGDDIASILTRHSGDTPERTALAEGERRVTWAELGRAVDRIAAALAAGGTCPGDRVAILASGSIEYVQVFFGVLRAGACAVPLPTLASPDALERMMVDSGSSALFTDRAHAGTAAAVAGGGVKVRVALDAGAPGFDALESWLERTVTVPPPAVALGPDDAFDVIYSSGTTGVPKGIVHSHGARRASYAGSRARYFSRDTVNLLATPLYSNTTSVTWLLTTAAGGTSVLLPKFSTDAFFDAVERHRVTHAMLVPVQYERILAAPRFASADLSSLQRLFCTSAPLRQETKARVVRETRADLVEIYGLTEGGPVTVLEARQHPDKLASVGRPSPGCDVRVVDESGRPLPPGQIGEVVGRSPNMMSGYLNRPEETNAMLLRDEHGALFFRTGDMGRFDDDGFLYLLDRKKDVIISGGLNVYAADLEAVLATHPAVAEVAVIGIPSERWGETPLALVVARPGAGATADELRDWCNARVGKAQRVAGVELRDDLPKSAIGKVLKRELRAPYWKA